MIVEQETELKQLHQEVDQLQAEKKEELGRSEKLAKELKGKLIMVGIIMGGLIPCNDSLRCLQNIAREPKDNSTRWSSSFRSK